MLEELLRTSSSAASCGNTRATYSIRCSTKMFRRIYPHRSVELNRARKPENTPILP